MQFRRYRHSPVWDDARWDDGHIEYRPSGKGYMHVKRPDYPRCDRHGWAQRSHVVWWLRTGQVVPVGYNVHHRDDNSLNDRFYNLELLLHGEHTRLTVSKPRVELVCAACGVVFYRLESRAGRFCSRPCAFKRIRSQEEVEGRRVAIVVGLAARKVSMVGHLPE